MTVVLELPALIERLKTVGAGWVRLPAAGESGLNELGFRAAFMDR
jgi:hypothetical protein